MFFDMLWISIEYNNILVLFIIIKIGRKYHIWKNVQNFTIFNSFWAISP